jgi:hypothetical protein
MHGSAGSAVCQLRVMPAGAQPLAALLIHTVLSVEHASYCISYAGQLSCISSRCWGGRVHMTTLLLWYETQWQTTDSGYCNDRHCTDDESRGGCGCSSAQRSFIVLCASCSADEAGTTTALLVRQAPHLGHLIFCQQWGTGGDDVSGGTGAPGPLQMPL